MKLLSAPPDGGRAGSHSTLSVADQLRAVDTSVLDRLVAIRQEETRLDAFRTRANDMKGHVSEHVFRRVLDDYSTRGAALDQQAMPLKSKARSEYRKLHQLVDDVSRIHDQAKLEKEELEFRHAVGELDDNQLAQGLAAPQSRLDQCEADLARIEECTARFVEAFGSKAALEAPDPVPAAGGVRPTPMQMAEPAPLPPPLALPPPIIGPVSPPRIDLEATGYIPPPSDALDLTPTYFDGAGLLIDDPSKTAPLPAPIDDDDGATILVPLGALIAEPGAMPQTEYRLGAINYLGRAEDNQVQIMSPEVSRKHAVITAVGSGFELKDLGSQNGVNVNGVRTNTRRLVDGDRVEIAGISLVFRSPWPARGTNAAAAAKR